MKGAPHTHDAVTLVDGAGREVTLTLADVAAASLKSLYTMHPTFDEQTCWLQTEAPLAARCEAEGEAVGYAGTHAPATFLIRAKDWVGRECTSGGAYFEVRLRGPVNLQAEVVDRGDGTYAASYTAAISGSYSMHVTLNRVPIAGSPFSLLVDPDQTRPEYCVAEGAGLTSAEAGKAATFTILKQDRHGNARTRGVDHFYADVQGPGKWDCRIKDERDGSFTVTYTAKTAGTYRLDVGLAPNAGPIASSPFTIVVRPSAPDPRTTTLVAPPPATVLCGRPFTLQLVARDRWGNLCANAPSPPSSPVGARFGGGSVVKADVGEEQPSAWIVADSAKGRENAVVSLVEPGLYNLSLTPVAQGRNMAHVCWAGMNVKGSPFQLKALPAPPHAASYQLTYKPRSWPLLVAGVKFKLRVQAHDRFGNLYTAGCPRPLVYLLGTGATAMTAADAGGSALSPLPRRSGSPSPGGRRGVPASPEPATLSPRDIATGQTLTTRLRSQLLSDFGLGDSGKPLPQRWAHLLSEMEEMHSALEVSDAPFQPSSETNSARLRDYGDDASRRAKLVLAASAQLDPEMSITLNMKNPEDVTQADAKEGLTLLAQRCCRCEVTDLAHGVYEVIGTPLHAGTYKLCLKLTQRTPSAADPVGGTKSVGSGASVAAITSHAGAVGAALRPEEAEAVALVVENAEASAVAFEEATGVLCAEVRVVAGPVFPSSCTLSGGGLSVAHEKERAIFELVAIDKHGNAATSGGETFELRAHRLLPAGGRKPARLEYEITDCADGRYTVAYTPTIPGRWELALTLLPRMDGGVGHGTVQFGGSAAGSAPPSPEKHRSVSGFTRDDPLAAAPTPEEMVGGRSFMIIVRPALSKDLSPLEAAATMEAHARLETAFACEAHSLEKIHERHPRKDGVDPGDGLDWALAGESVEFVVRLPPRPLRSPPRKVVRRNSTGGEDVLSGPLGLLDMPGRVASWSAAEHLVLDQAKLTINGKVERQTHCEDVTAPEFVLSSCRDNGDGKFYVRYCSSVAGTLRLNVELAGGGQIAGSPFGVKVLPGPVVPANGTAGGKGLHEAEVGVGCFLEVFARDKNGNARLYEDGEYAVRIVRAPPKMQSREHAAKDVAKGRRGEGEEFEVKLRAGPECGCRAHYTLLEPGVYVAHVATGKDGEFVPVRGSPFAMHCAAGPIELSCCSILEVGIAGEPLARTVSTGGGRLWVQTRDQLANPRSTPSSHELWCELRGGGAAVQCACVDLGDGRVEVTYPVGTPAGLLQVWIGLVNTDPLGHTQLGLTGGRRMRSPLGSTEHRLGMLNMQEAIRFGDDNLVAAPGVLKVKPGMLFDVHVVAVDDAGRQQMTGGEQLRAALSSGPAPVALEVYDNGDGSYRVATAVQVSGEYRIAFLLNGLQVAGSPITLIAPRGNNERSPSPRLGVSSQSGHGTSGRGLNASAASTARSGASTARSASPRRGMTREQHHSGRHGRESPRGQRGGASPRASSPRKASPPPPGAGKHVPQMPRMPTLDVTNTAAGREGADPFDKERRN